MNKPIIDRLLFLLFISFLSFLWQFVLRTPPKDEFKYLERPRNFEQLRNGYHLEQDRLLRDC